MNIDVISLCSSSCRGQYGRSACCTCSDRGSAASNVTPPAFSAFETGGPVDIGDQPGPLRFPSSQFPRPLSGDARRHKRIQSLTNSASPVSRYVSGPHTFRFLRVPLFAGSPPVENTVWVYSVDFIGRYLANACRTAAPQREPRFAQAHWRTI
jgi:hypothetical protein